MKLGIKLFFATVAIAGMAAQAQANGHHFILVLEGQGEIRCNDASQGGDPRAYVTECIDIGNGSNHGCDQVGTFGCRAWERHGNGGSAGCEAVCQR